MSNMSLKMKIILMSVAMVLIPVIVISAFSLFEFNQFGEEAIDDATKGITEEAKGSLTHGVTAAREEVNGLINSGRLSTQSIAESSVLNSYLASKAGENEMLNEFSRKEMSRILKGLIGTCKTAEELSTDGKKQTDQAPGQKLAARQIRAVTVGEDGYAFAMDSEGTLVVHPKKNLEGQNTVTDLGLNEFRKILSSKSSSTVQFLNYTFEGQRKFVAYQFFAPWDWVVAVSGYWADLSKSAAAFSRKQLLQEIQSLYRSTTIAAGNDRSVRMLDRIRYIGADGTTEIDIYQGQTRSNETNVASKAWFQKASNMPEGEIYNAGVIRPELGQKSDMLFAAPVYVAGEVKGVAAVNMNWSLAWKLLDQYTFGETGYAYITSSKGLLISHPKYSLTDRVDITASKYGKLADITTAQMLAGQSGVEKYTFEGVEKYVAFKPFPVGSETYSIAATSPVDEFMASVHKMEKQANSRISSTTRFIVIGSVVFGIIGVVVAFFFGRGIVNKLVDVIDGLRSGAEQVAAASTQVSQSSQEMAEGNSEQASSLEESSASLEEMSSMTQQNSGNASEADGLMRETQDVVKDGVQTMQKMSSAIEDIDESSAETAKIIDTIDEIAFQTNLLALNAAVEAARAGEAGKGFAVVAEEVRNLAQRSAEAASDTAELIEGSRENVEEGVAATEELEDHMETIQERTGKAQTMIAEISAASDEQADGIEQVNEAVAQMNEVVQQSASNSEETASAAEELSSQAQEMNAMVEQLANIVGGEADDSDTASVSTSGNSYSGNQGNNPKTSNNQSSPGGSAKQSQTSDSDNQSESPEQVIPLDSDNFEDF